MDTKELCTEEEVSILVHAFYARVRQDEVLGPIFNTHIVDWDHHLAKLTDFWSAILRRTARFSGAPCPSMQRCRGSAWSGSSVGWVCSTPRWPSSPTEPWPSRPRAALRKACGWATR